MFLAQGDSQPQRPVATDIPRFLRNGGKLLQPPGAEPVGMPDDQATLAIVAIE